MKDRLELIFRRAQALLRVASQRFRLAALRQMRAAPQVRIFGALPGRRRPFARSLKGRRDVHSPWAAEVQTLESRTLLSAVDPSQIAATSVVAFHGAPSQGNEIAVAFADAFVNFQGGRGLCEFDLIFGRLPYYRTTRADDSTELAAASPAVGKVLSIPQWPGKKSLTSTPGKWPDAPAVPLRWAA